VSIDDELRGLAPNLLRSAEAAAAGVSLHEADRRWVRAGAGGAGRRGLLARAGWCMKT
jgi:hypothetical protein